MIPRSIRRGRGFAALFGEPAMQVSIHKAAKTGNLDQVKAHLNAGRDVNERNIYGKTPLGLALQFSQKEIAKYLKEHGGKE
jgi:ankyrin repeat protein